MKAVAPFIADPVAVDGFVYPRLEARDAILIRFHADIAAGAAARANGRRLLQVPDAHFEPEIAIRQRAYRTDVIDIGGQGIVEYPIRKDGDGGMIAAIDDRQLIRVRDFLQKTNAAGTFDAAFAVEHHVRPKDFPFTVVFLSRLEAARLQIMTHVIILQPAFPRLVTDRAIQRMVDE